MLLGLNESLEKTIADFRVQQDNIDRTDVLHLIAMSVAVKDDWFVSVNVLTDEESPADYPDEQLFADLPGIVKKRLVRSDGKTFLFAYTSPGKVHSEGPDQVITVRYSAAKLLREYAEAPTETGFVINPWSGDFELSVQDAMNLLAASIIIDPADLLPLRRYYLEPKAVLNVQAILDSWNHGWNDNGAEPEQWRYLCCPIMADGRILLLFESCDKIYGGKNYILHVDHIINHYRVLEYRIGKDGPEELGKYRFSLQNGVATSVILYDGVLKAAVRTTNSQKVTILPMVPNNDDGQFKIYENVRRIVSRSDGSLAVGYYGNLCDNARRSVMVFDSEGNAISQYEDDYALHCADITLDSKEQIWFHLYPSGELIRLTPDLSHAERHRVALQGFCGFALSDDLSTLFLDFGEDGYGSVHYILSRNQNGDYTDPVRFDFPPKSSGEAEEVAAHFPSSTMKSWVCIQAGNKLYLYDLNDK